MGKFQDRPDFSLTLMTASINYLHREKFRSDVLVTFHAPIVLTPQQDSKLFSTNNEERTEAIKKLTDLLENTVRSNLLDAQDWKTVRLGHVARKLYGGDLGTRISLGQYVRLTRKFVAVFSHSQQSTEKNSKEENASLVERRPDQRSPAMAKSIDELGKDLAVGVTFISFRRFPHSFQA